MLSQAGEGKSREPSQKMRVCSSSLTIIIFRLVGSHHRLLTKNNEYFMSIGQNIYQLIYVRYLTEGRIQLQVLNMYV